MTVTRGLEGVVATSSSISSIINDTLTYVGYNIDDLTENASFEEVIYLLWHRKLPTKAQLNELKQQLSSSQNPFESYFWVPSETPGAAMFRLRPVRGPSFMQG